MPLPAPIVGIIANPASGRDLRRLAEEGQGTNNYNAWWYVYIFWCNQTAWFMPGRMLAYLVLEKALPVRWEPYPKPDQSRVAPYTDLALAEARTLLTSCRITLRI